MHTDQRLSHFWDELILGDLLKMQQSRDENALSLCMYIMKCMQNAMDSTRSELFSFIFDYINFHVWEKWILFNFHMINTV